MASQLTRGNFVTKVADMLGRETTATARSGATHASILQEAYEWTQMRIAREFSFPELDTRDTTTGDTVASTLSYSYTTLFGSGTRVKEVLSVVIEDGTSSNRLTRKLHREFLRDYPNPEGDSTGKPSFYIRVGNALWFYPVPDQAYDIHTIYSKWPTRATTDSSTSDYDYIDDVIIAGMAYEYLNHLGERTKAESWDKIFKDKLKESVVSIIHPTDWEPEGRAFNSSLIVPGDYYNSPFIMRNP